MSECCKWVQKKSVPENCKYAQKKCKGDVTAFLSLIFILLITFVGGIMESASIQLAKNYRRTDTDRAMECVFAEYQKELLEEYDVFALDGSYEIGRASCRERV